jgi:hypothetical protein
MSLLSIAGWSVLLLLAAIYAFGMVGGARLRKARAQYARVQREHGDNAPYHCPHAFVSLSRGRGGGHKWCRVCGKHVGPADAPKS